MDAELEQQLQEHGLARVAGALRDHALDALRLETTAVEETALPAGASKIGGRPDLPPNVAWPYANGRPMAFVAQINLADVAGYDCARELPASGLLSFFVASEDEGDAGEGAAGAPDRASCAVLYSADPTQLATQPAPADLAAWDQYTPCAVTLQAISTLPAVESSAVTGLGLSEQERAAYIDLYLGIEGSYYDRTLRPEHRLLGHPYNLEGNALVAAMLAARGDGEGGFDPDPLVQAQHEQEAADWLLLLQVDSDEAAGMDWNGGGLIYFCITRTALRARDFGAVWLTAQFL